MTTHPSVLRAVIRYAKSKGAARILVGESPGFQLGSAAFRKSGLAEAAQSEGAVWADFGEAVQVDNPDGRLVKNFTLARVAVEADVLISLPKLKNHTLMYFTGAMKNIFGCVPGLQKPQFHLRFPERERFGRMIVDLNVALRSDFSIMDAVVGMEGPGPGAGYPRRDRGRARLARPRRAGPNRVPDHRSRSRPRRQSRGRNDQGDMDSLR